MKLHYSKWASDLDVMRMFRHICVTLTQTSFPVDWVVKDTHFCVNHQRALDYLIETAHFYLFFAFCIPPTHKMWVTTCPKVISHYSSPLIPPGSSPTGLLIPWIYHARPTHPAFTWKHLTSTQFCSGLRTNNGTASLRCTHTACPIAHPSHKYSPHAHVPGPLLAEWVEEKTRRGSKYANLMQYNQSTPQSKQNVMMGHREGTGDRDNRQLVKGLKEATFCRGLGE